METKVIKPLLRSLFLSYVLSALFLGVLAFALYKLRLRESPVFRRSTRKFPSFSSCHFFISFPASRFFLYLQQIFNALLGLFLLKKFF